MTSCESFRWKLNVFVVEKRFCEHIHKSHKANDPVMTTVMLDREGVLVMTAGSYKLTSELAL